MQIQDDYLVLLAAQVKVAVFALRLDTYPKPKQNQVFYIGTNSPGVFWEIRRKILSEFKNLPTSGEYLHRDCYDAAKKYSKDTFIAIDKMALVLYQSCLNLNGK